MGLYLEKELDSGVIVKYWNINRVEFAWFKNGYIRCLVFVNGFLDKASRDANKNAVVFNQVFELDCNVFDFLTFYTKLKETEFFSGAIDA